MILETVLKQAFIISDHKSYFLRLCNHSHVVSIKHIDRAFLRQILEL